MCSSIRFLLALAIFSFLSYFLTACVGGRTSSASTGTTYVTAAAPGELVTYTVDTTALTYSYTRTGGGSLGKGIIVASTQTAMNTAQIDGTWFAHGINSYNAVFTTSGSNVHYTNVNGSATNTYANVTLENPWTGMGWSAANLPVLLVEQGVYVAANTGTGYIEVGLKYN